MEANKCQYRKQDHDCKIYPMNRTLNHCSNCLQGQHIESMELLSGAIMALIESNNDMDEGNIFEGIEVRE